MVYRVDAWTVRPVYRRSAAVRLRFHPEVISARPSDRPTQEEKATYRLNLVLLLDPLRKAADSCARPSR
jgi:hypothetical protein